MTYNEIMLFLESKGSEQTRKVLVKHGARDPFFGVKVADLKIIQKKVKVDHQMALDLYKSGNSDAMYLAALICDPKKFTKETLQEWVESAYWYMLSDYAVAWVAAESFFGKELAIKWINSDEELIQSAGWATYSSLLAITNNENLDRKEIEHLLSKIETDIHQSKNRTRFSMNGFVIAAGAYFPELTEYCKNIGNKIGKVNVDMGGTSCKVPDINTYIEKVEKRGSIGKKKKRAVC